VVFNFFFILEVDLHLRASLEFSKERKLALSFIRTQVCGNHPKMLVLVRWLSLQENVQGVCRYVIKTLVGRHKVLAHFFFYIIPILDIYETEFVIG
jgi:hypothetical protein